MKSFVAGLLLALTLTSAVTAASPPINNRELLDSVLWVQQSAEYRESARIVYRQATHNLVPSLTMPGSAATEQNPASAASLPPAVILDLDETVLDNSAYSGWLLSDEGNHYTSESWAEWMRLKQAGAIPGSLEFTQAATQLGIKVLYVTNRKCADVQCDAKKYTMANMEKFGFPGATDPSAVLLKNERPDWGDDKTTRRAYLAKSYRIIMMVGDNLADFLSTDVVKKIRENPSDPAHQILENQFGYRWFILPNPMYGGWYDALPKDLEGRYNTLHVAPLLPLASNEHISPVVIPDDAPSQRSNEPASGTISKNLKLATWNMDWLMTPATYDALKPSCKPYQPASNERAFPCAPGKAPPPRHSGQDFVVLAKYAAQLGADAVALEEIDGVEPAALVFGSAYNVDCFANRSHPQKTGFAIRKGIPYRCNPEVTSLDVDGHTRSGADVTLFPDSPDAIRLLAVHMKSGCFNKVLDNTSVSACSVLRKQIPVLENWMDARIKEGQKFAILGDFNREIEVDAKISAGPDEQHPLSVVAALSDNDPVGAILVRSTDGFPFAPCSSKDDHDQYIDAILMSQSLANSFSGWDSFRQPYTDSDLKNRVLSDHCPTGVTLHNILH